MEELLNGLIEASIDRNFETIARDSEDYSNFQNTGFMPTGAWVQIQDDLKNLHMEVLRSSNNDINFDIPENIAIVPVDLENPDLKKSTEIFLMDIYEKILNGLDIKSNVQRKEGFWNDLINEFEIKNKYHFRHKNPKKAKNPIYQPVNKEKKEFHVSPYKNKEGFGLDSVQKSRIKKKKYKKLTKNEWAVKNLIKELGDKGSASVGAEDYQGKNDIYNDVYDSLSKGRLTVFDLEILASPGFENWAVKSSDYKEMPSIPLYHNITKILSPVFHQFLIEKAAEITIPTKDQHHVDFSRLLTPKESKELTLLIEGTDPSKEQPKSYPPKKGTKTMSEQETTTPKTAPEKLADRHEKVGASIDEMISLLTQAKENYEKAFKEIPEGEKSNWTYANNMQPVLSVLADGKRTVNKILDPSLVYDLKAYEKDLTRQFDNFLEKTKEKNPQLLTENAEKLINMQRERLIKSNPSYFDKEKDKTIIYLTNQGHGELSSLYSKIIHKPAVQQVKDKARQDYYKKQKGFENRQAAKAKSTEVERD